MNTIPNPEIEKLRTEKESNEAKLRYCKNQLKALSQEEQNLERNSKISSAQAMITGLKLPEAQPAMGMTADLPD